MSLREILLIPGIAALLAAPSAGFLKQETNDVFLLEDGFSLMLE